MVEEQLVKRAIRGDSAAVEELLNAYQPKIYAVCFRVLKSEHDADDAAQNALLKIYLNVKKFRFSSSFSTWVYTIARNAAFDILKRQKGNISADELKESGFDVPDTTASVEERVVNDEMKKKVSECISLLNSEQKQCLVLKDIDGYAIEEVAEILALPVGTVKSRLHRGRERLKELLIRNGVWQ